MRLLPNLCLVVLCHLIRNRFYWCRFTSPKEKNKFGLKLKQTNQIQAIYMHAHLRGTYYNLVRQVSQISNCYKGSK